MYQTHSSYTNQDHINIISNDILNYVWDFLKLEEILKLIRINKNKTKFFESYFNSITSLKNTKETILSLYRRNICIYNIHLHKNNRYFYKTILFLLLNNCKRLKSINTLNNYLSTMILNFIPKNIKFLKYLNIKIKNDTEIMLIMNKFANLEKISLSSNLFKYYNSTYLIPKNLNHLIEINFKNIKISSDFIYNLTHLSKLKKLSISFSNLTDDMCIFISKYLTKLEILDFYGNKLLGKKGIISLAKMNYLKQLDIRMCSVDTKDIIYLFEKLDHFQSLRILYVPLTSYMDLDSFFKKYRPNSECVIKF